MTNEWAIIIASMITIGGSVIIFLLNMRFNSIANERAMKERFFYDVLPIRRKFYEELFAEITKFPKEYESLDIKTFNAIFEFVMEIEQPFTDLLIRATVCASKDVILSLTRLSTVFIKIKNYSLSLEQISEGNQATEFATKNILKGFFTSCQTIIEELRIKIRIEIGTENADEVISQLTKSSREIFKKKAKD